MRLLHQNSTQMAVGGITNMRAKNVQKFILGANINLPSSPETRGDKSPLSELSCPVHPQTPLPTPERPVGYWPHWPGTTPRSVPTYMRASLGALELVFSAAS